MDDVMLTAIGRAVLRHGFGIVPCGETWEAAWEFCEEFDQYILWYDDINGSTHIIRVGTVEALMIKEGA